MRKSSLGFTLLELVAIIAILVILAAILFPVFARAHEHMGPMMPSTLSTYQSACNMYASDNNDRFPITNPLEFGVNPLSQYFPNPQAKRKECFRSPACELRKTIGYEDIKFQYILNSKCPSLSGDERILLGPKSLIESSETVILFSVVLKRLKDRIPVGFIEGRPRIQKIGDLVKTPGPCQTLSSEEPNSNTILQLRSHNKPLANWQIPSIAVEQFRSWAEIKLSR